jgi:bifunctional DNA-binding transcriptional regulator/antitoxin component of YhaV-PrlF toxin-antitoxin module
MAVTQRNTGKTRRGGYYVTISPAFQTTISAEAIRRLNLRPGMRLTQTIDGNRLILEPLMDIESLAGALGGGKERLTTEEMNKAAIEGMVAAGLKGLIRDE